MDATAAGAALAKDCGLVMLYHAVFERPPDALAGGLHNVRPSALRAQLEAVGRHFEFVDADTIAALPDPRGHAAVTFDDGYRSVFDSALPVLESLGIPFTVYLNGAAFDGAAFWRDKVRLVQAMGWVSEFESFMRGIVPIAGRRFYRYSKDPSVDSARIDAELDRFLEFKGAAAADLDWCVPRTEDLPRHPLVAYGNHGHHHYVMSSLDAGRQLAEIRATDEMLARLGGRRISGLFSLPFGDAADMNAATGEALRKTGYDTVLMSRNRPHAGPGRLFGVAAVERFMPGDDPVAFWPRQWLHHHDSEQAGNP